MKIRVVVAAIIRNRDGPYPDTWHLLGGGVEKGEDLEEALQREIQEEAGVTINNIQKISVDEDNEPDKNGEMTHYIFHVFSCDYDSGKLTPGDDIAKLQWFSESEIKDISVARPSVKLFRKLGMI